MNTTDRLAQALRDAREFIRIDRAYLPRLSAYTYNALMEKVHSALAEHEAAPTAPDAHPSAAPIDMVLHCPKCGEQHIDAPEPGKALGYVECDGMPCMAYSEAWDNPPHRSHKCHGCGHIWRPADVPTNGVAAVQTKGNADSPVAHPAAALRGEPEPTDEQLVSVRPAATHHKASPPRSTTMHGATRSAGTPPLCWWPNAML